MPLLIVQASHSSSDYASLLDKGDEMEDIVGEMSEKCFGSSPALDDTKDKEYKV